MKPGRSRYLIKFTHDPQPCASPGEDYVLGRGIWSAKVYAHDSHDAKDQIAGDWPKLRNGVMVNRIIISCRKIYY